MHIYYMYLPTSTNTILVEIYVPRENISLWAFHISGFDLAFSWLAHRYEDWKYKYIGQKVHTTRDDKRPEMKDSIAKCFLSTFLQLFTWIG